MYIGLGNMDGGETQCSVAWDVGTEEQREQMRSVTLRMYEWFYVTNGAYSYAKDRGCTQLPDIHALLDT